MTAPTSKTGPFGAPATRTTTGTSDPAALAAQINAEAEQKTASNLLCPAFKPNHHVGGVWADPDLRHIAAVKPMADGSGYTVKLHRYDADGALAATLTGTGSTARDAYADAHHQHRRAKHSIEDLYRQIADEQAQTHTATNAFLVACALRLQERTKRQRALQRARARSRKQDDAVQVIARLEAALNDAKRRIGELEHDGLEKDKGMALIRQAVNHAYPGTEALTLDKRIEGLGKARDSWQARALAAEAANRAETRDSAHAAQRIQS